MGNAIATRINRLFDYPIKRKPICYYRQEDFSSTGEFATQQYGDITNIIEYERITNEFYSKLLARRKQTKEKIDRAGGRTNNKDLAKKYSAWNEMTISYLHSLFLLFQNENYGSLDFDAFETVLESLGDESSSDKRMKKFTEADTDAEGSISYEEFLQLIYTFDNKLAKLCTAATEKIKFIDSLTLGEQLEYGLF